MEKTLQNIVWFTYSISVSYKTSSRLFLSFENEFDHRLFLWKQQTEEDVKTEKELPDQMKGASGIEEKV